MFNGLALVKGAEVEPSYELKPVSRNAYLRGIRLVKGAEVEPSYELWTLEKGLTAGVNDAGTDDAETPPDGLCNLLEYAFGGDPLADDADAVRPIGFLTTDGGSNVLEYVYKRRTDDVSLEYDLKLKTDLVLDVDGTSVGTVYQTGVGPVVDSIQSVTNRFPTIDDKKFIQLDVTETQE